MVAALKQKLKSGSYLCTVAALRVVVVLGGELAVCIFIRGYTVVVVLIIIDAQVQRV